MSPIGPTEYFVDIHAIDPAELVARGKTTMLVDLDNTLVPRDAEDVPAETVAWIRSVKAAGMTVVLVSNNWHARAHTVAEELGVEAVAKAVKPLPFAFWRAMGKAGAKASTSVIVGDQIFTDVVGGKLLGIETLLVEPQSTYDLPHTLALRKVEGLILKGRTPRG